MSCLKILINNFNNSNNKIEIDLSRKNKILLRGSSGSGESSFLNMIAGIRGYEGKIECGSIAYLPQEYVLFDHLNIMENLRIANQRISNEEINRYLSRIDIDPNILVKNLSGGQKQRICIIRTIITGRDILLFDEPTSALDHKNTKRIIEILTEIDRKIIIATHDDEFEGFCDLRIKFIKNNIIL